MIRGLTIFAAVLLLFIATGANTVSADIDITEEGTYYRDSGQIWRWVGVGTVHVDAFVYAGRNFEETAYKCEEWTYISFMDGGATLESAKVRENTCDVNNIPSPIGLSGDLSYGERVATTAAYTGMPPCWACGDGQDYSVVTFSKSDRYTVSGTTGCVDSVVLYIFDGSDYRMQNHTDSAAAYSFPIFDGSDYRLVLDGAYYDFTCDGNEVFDYDACIYVYGYTCGIDTIKLYKDDGGWVLNDTEAQSTGYEGYEMPIVDGVDYKISFVDSTIDGDIVVHNQTFSCVGDHVLIDFDRCEWVYPPNGDPYIIYLWSGYDYNIVIAKDAHGNFIENSQIAIYDKTTNTHIHKWTDSADGYMLLGAKFATDHDVQISIRTFDGIFTLDTVFPANGTAAVGEEDIVATNWTIPIMYNLGLQPVDQNDKPLFDVFCGLVEYTPLNPLSFWGMDLSNRGHVSVTNCSGFAMCDIVAEKDGYADYNVSMINWTSRSALIKDYRHNIVMEETQ